MSANAKWDDLIPRVTSAIAMIAVGGLALWAGGIFFSALVLVVIGGMIWELISMCSPQRPNGAFLGGGLAAVSLAAGYYVPAMLLLPVLGAFLIVFWGFIGAHRERATAYAAIIWVGGLGLLQLRLSGGVMPMLWLVCIVVATDVAGYFAGRVIGGPKFWPAISPKKTWSGTAAGWLAAALVGYWFLPSFVAFFDASSAPMRNMLILSVLVSFASQMGDIVESAIKRKTGIKDSSNLIPGHGGLLDRFDGMIGAAVLVSLWSLMSDAL